jgi:hypothetical protein
MALQSVTATFTATSTPQVVSWTTMPGNYVVDCSEPVISSGGAVGVYLTSVTASGATVNTTAAFTGTVSVIVLDVP